MIQKIMKPFAFGYEIELASKSDVSPNTPKADGANHIVWTVYIAYNTIEMVLNC